MSVMRVLLNAYLRHLEKPQLARATDPLALRRAFERKARVFFHAPPGARFEREPLGDCPAIWVNRDTPGPLILHLHGGAFVFGSANTHRAMLAWLSRASRCPAVLPDYRLAPENPYPAAIDDAVAAYRAVMHTPQGVVLGGDSAGGGLALAVLAETLQKGWPPPLGVFTFSALTDLTFSGDSAVANAQSDVVLPMAVAEHTRSLYLRSEAPEDRRASPLYATFKAAPPVYMTAGDTEALLDDTRRMAARLEAHGVDVTTEIGRDLPHVWPIFHNLLPEARQTMRRLAGWINRLSRSGDDS